MNCRNNNEINILKIFSHLRTFIDSIVNLCLRIFSSIIEWMESNMFSPLINQKPYNKTEAEYGDVNNSDSSCYSCKHIDSNNHCRIVKQVCYDIEDLDIIKSKGCNNQKKINS